MSLSCAFRFVKEPVTEPIRQNFFCLSQWGQQITSMFVLVNTIAGHFQPNALSLLCFLFSKVFRVVGYLTAQKKRIFVHLFAAKFLPLNIFWWKIIGLS